MKYPPSFDGRAILYPDIKNVRDYFAWRQVDCTSPPLTPSPSFTLDPTLKPLSLDESGRMLMEGHINNLHNTTYWALVNSGMSEQDATKRLEGTESSDKNEILWAEFGMNYNKELAIFRKGTVIYREVLPTLESGL